MEAGRHWAKGGDGDSDREARADAAAFGLPVPEEPAAEDRAMPVLPENWEALEVFSACATQWRRGGMEGQMSGLDYGAVESARRMMGVEDMRDCFERVRWIERGALAQVADEADARRLRGASRGN